MNSAHLKIATLIQFSLIICLQLNAECGICPWLDGESEFQIDTTVYEKLEKAVLDELERTPKIKSAKGIAEEMRKKIIDARESLLANKVDLNAIQYDVDSSVLILIQFKSNYDLTKAEEAFFNKQKIQSDTIKANRVEIKSEDEIAKIVLTDLFFDLTPHVDSLGDGKPFVDYAPQKRVLVHSDNGIVGKLPTDNDYLQTFDTIMIKEGLQFTDNELKLIFYDYITPHKDGDFTIEGMRLAWVAYEPKLKFLYGFSIPTEEYAQLVIDKIRDLEKEKGIWVNKFLLLLVGSVIIGAAIWVIISKKKIEYLNILKKAHKGNVYLSIIDRNNNVEWSNEKILIGENYLKISTAKNRTKLTDIINKMRNGEIKEHYTYESTLNNSNMQSTVIPLDIQNKLALVETDISRLKEKEEELAIKNKELQSKSLELEAKNKKLKTAQEDQQLVLRMIGHDLLPGIEETSRGLGKIDKRQLEANQVQKIVAAQVGLDRSFALCQNLKVWADKVFDKKDFYIQSLILRQVIKTVSQDISGSLTAKSIHLHTEQIPKEMRIFGDAGLVEAIFRNILSNAVRHGFEENIFDKVHEINISAEHDIYGEGINITISDNGNGLKIGLLQNLNNFYGKQENEVLEKRTFEKDPNIGMGTIFVRKFVQKHMGRIWVNSKNGQGTSVKIYFPNKLRPSITS